VSIIKGALPPGQVLNGIVTISHSDKANIHLPMLVFRNRRRHPDSRVARNMAMYKKIGSLSPGTRTSRTRLNARNTYAIRRKYPNVRSGLLATGEPFREELAGAGAAFSPSEWFSRPLVIVMQRKFVASDYYRQAKLAAFLLL